jgi:quercetin dioxygenase-like cupin family protein
MKPVAAVAAAHTAVAVNPSKPATATLHDSPDLRLLVFRLSPGQEVPPHRSVSTVMLTVLAGTGTLTGDPESSPNEAVCEPGDVVIYAPNEIHGMRATHGPLLLLATITPRPGERSRV